MRSALVPLAALLLASGCKKPAPPPDPERPPAAESAPVEPDAPPRCAPIGEPFVIGDGKPSAVDGGDDLLPFAAEVGEGTAFGGGFAVGAIWERAGATVAAVVTLGDDGRGGKIIELGTMHGDVDPPSVAANGKTIVAGLLGPEPNGRTLRLAKVENGAVTWGASLAQKSDESQAFDLALGEARGVAAWDEDGEKGGTIQLSTFDLANPSHATPARKVSGAGVDAESPRLAKRPGGFWLAYVGRSGGDDDADAHYQAETIGHRWLEIVPLDANGSPTGPARAITAKDGHVIAYDVQSADDGGALVTFRDDDTPSGSSGGQVYRVAVHPSAVEEPAVLADDRVGAGVPTLLGRWVGITDAADVTRLAPLAPSGELAAPLRREPAVGAGEPLAAAGDVLFVARPAGKVVRLLAVRCAESGPPLNPPAP